MLKAIALTTVWYTGYRTVVDCSPIDVVPYCFAICYCLVQSYCEEKRTLSLQSEFDRPRLNITTKNKYS